jgi:hypothetical protein
MKNKSKADQKQELISLAISLGLPQNELAEGLDKRLIIFWQKNGVDLDKYLSTIINKILSIKYVVWNFPFPSDKRYDLEVEELLSGYNPKDYAFMHTTFVHKFHSRKISIVVDSIAFEDCSKNYNRISFIYRNWE